jgi:hypothetical protein
MGFDDTAGAGRRAAGEKSPGLGWAAASPVAVTSFRCSGDPQIEG